MIIFQREQGISDTKKTIKIKNTTLEECGNFYKANMKINLKQQLFLIMTDKFKKSKDRKCFFKYQQKI